MVCRRAELLPPPPAGLLLQDLAQSPCVLLAICWGCWWCLHVPTSDTTTFRLVVPVLPSILLELIPRKGKAWLGIGSQNLALCWGGVAQLENSFLMLGEMVLLCSDQSIRAGPGENTGCCVGRSRLTTSRMMNAGLGEQWMSSWLGWFLHGLKCFKAPCCPSMSSCSQAGEVLGGHYLLVNLCKASCMSMPRACTTVRLGMPPCEVGSATTAGLGVLSCEVGSATRPDWVCWPSPRTGL